MQKSYPANTDLPVQGLLIAGGFIFSKTAFSKKIPYDPKLYFHGEELSLALRLFTHGWSVTHIPRVPIFHLYTDVKNLVRKLHWNEEDEKHRAIKWNELDKLSKSRLTDLIFSRVEEPFGLGAKRSVQEFINICGIDLFNKEVIDIDIATNNFPNTADGTRSLSLAYLAIVALQARPKAVTRPKKSPKKFPKFRES